MKIKNVHGAPLLLCVITVLLIVVHFADVSFLAIDGNVYLSAAVLEVIIFAIPSAFYARARGRKYISRMRLRFIKAVDIPLMIWALGFMFFGGATLNYYFYKLVPELYAASSTSAAISSGVSSFGTGLYAVVAVGILPALTEEFLFRGIILTEYELNGTTLAVILSSVTFSMIHFSFVRLPVYFFYGVILALVLYVTRSIFASMIIHMANNVLVMFFEVYVYRAAVIKGVGIVLFTFICTALTLLFAFLFFSSASKAYYDLSAKNVPSDHTKRKKPGKLSYAAEALTSPLFILLVILSIAGMIINL